MISRLRAVIMNKISYYIPAEKAVSD